MNQGIDYFAGVPDSLLNAFCLELTNKYEDKVTIGVNEGACVALASGHYISTSKTPCVFMQNSGLGNIVNPYTSLAHKKVYGIPMLYIIGWRGELEIKDEPQHKFMGEATIPMIETLGIKYKILDKNVTIDDVAQYIEEFKEEFKNGQTCAFVIKKGTFNESEYKVTNAHQIIREEAIKHILTIIGKDCIVVSTTGKISRELFEVREKLNMAHDTDFLTVGSMGFASSIAAQIARDTPTKKVYCIDGDGAALMHMGSMASIGNLKLNNFTHIILDNELHESVGGVPTVSNTVDWVGLAKALGYKGGCVITKNAELAKLKTIKTGELVVIKVAKYSRPDLGRPTSTPSENIAQLMEFIKKGENKQ